MPAKLSTQQLMLGLKCCEASDRKSRAMLRAAEGIKRQRLGQLSRASLHQIEINLRKAAGMK